MFKFTFNVNGGSSNPFTAQTEQQDQAQQVAPQTVARKLPAPPRPILPATDDGVRKSRKRGWTPMTGAPSAPQSQLTQTTGWLDTPSRYLEAASQSHQNRGDVEADGELPPAKKRRTLTDSILSTALSAALIGTTVGMTAYRMWRDRGKSGDTVPAEMMMDPPPPYAKEEWVDVKPKPAARSPRLSRKPRPVTRRTPRSRMVPIANSPVRLPPAHSPLYLPSSSTPMAVEQNEPDTEERGDLDEQMNWMSVKLRKLIEEGQKALGKEVVVMSDDPDGAVDDGQEGWEEVDDSLGTGPSSPTSPSHLRRTRKQPNSFAPCVSTAAWGGNKFTACDNDRSTLSRSRALRTGLSGRPGKETREVKVLYEPSSLAVPGPVVKELIDDQASKSLSEQARKIRQAYQIH